MRIKVSRLTNIYFLCAIFALTISESLNMRASQSGVEDSAFSRPLVVLTLLFWLFSAVKLAFPGYKLYKPPLPTSLYMLFFFWCFIPIVFGNQTTITDLVFNVSMTLTPMIVFLSSYNSTIQSEYEKSEKFTFLLMFFFLLLQYISIFREINFLSLAHIGSAFYLLYLLPLILTFNSKLIKISATVIVVLTLFLSMKRSGVLALGISLFCFIFVRQYVNHRFNVKSFVGSLVTIMAIGFLFVYLGSRDSGRENIFERFENIEKDQGSGRLEVWEHTAALITGQNTGSLMVGNGYNAVLRDSRLQLSAHNDLLEVTYDYGLIGTMLYIAAFLSITFYTVKMILSRSRYAPSMVMSYTIFFIQSMVSHIIIYYWASLFMLTWGYIIARNQIENFQASSLLPDGNQKTGTV